MNFDLSVDAEQDVAKSYANSKGVEATPRCDVVVVEELFCVIKDSTGTPTRGLWQDDLKTDV